MIDTIKAFIEFFLDFFSALSIFLGKDFDKEGILKVLDLIPADETAK